MNRQENTPKIATISLSINLPSPSLYLAKASLTLSTDLKIANKTRPIFARQQTPIIVKKLSGASFCVLKATIPAIKITIQMISLLFKAFTSLLA
ncbi:MAG: hypothetical protein MR582_01995 [Campylobacter sp.]|nr:hypothetical protein [Campylobacter sp.]